MLESKNLAFSIGHCVMLECRPGSLRTSCMSCKPIVGPSHVIQVGILVLLFSGYITMRETCLSPGRYHRLDKSSFAWPLLLLFKSRKSGNELTSWRCSLCPQIGYVIEILGTIVYDYYDVKWPVYMKYDRLLHKKVMILFIHYLSVNCAIFRIVI
jgi:hypothetical protein